MTARDTALKALIRFRREGAWADEIIRRELDRADLSPRDAALATAVFYGVLQNRILLDFRIDSLLTGRKKLPPALRDILRVGACQILFLDRVPDSAAVNEAVEQTKKRFSQREAGLCNGVLRGLSREKDNLETPRDYSVRYSHPPELVNLMKDSVGKRLETVLAADNSLPEVSVIVNSLKTTPMALERILRDGGVSVRPHPWLEGCFLLKGTGNLLELEAFSKGLFQVQDAAARLAVLAAEPKPGMRVLDLCAAPGGKSMAAAMEMGNRGQILACDVSGGRLQEIRRAAERLGVGIVSTLENDGTLLRPEWREGFDLVMTDVPCSGLGVIRKKPDIRYKNAADMEALPPMQRRLLEMAGSYVRPGGTLLYSTCTILRRENEDVAEDFLRSHPEFCPAGFALPETLACQRPGMLTLYQGIDCCDGFFLSVMRKRT